MNTHKRWAEKMMRPEGPAVTALERGGADRERRRIRRLQRWAMDELLLLVNKVYDYNGNCIATRARYLLDAATRAPRRRK